MGPSVHDDSGLVPSSSVLAFLCSCFPEGLPEGAGTGRGTMVSLTARIGQPMGESQTPGAARPLLFSRGCEGRDARARVVRNLREQSSLPRRGPCAQSPGPSSLPRRERQRGSCEATKGGAVLAFLCSCFPKGLGGPGDDVLPHREDRSTDGGIADSSRRKTPLVLPCEGRDARARVAPNLRERVLSLMGGRRSSSGERQRGSCEATRGSVKGSGPP